MKKENIKNKEEHKSTETPCCADSSVCSIECSPKSRKKESKCDATLVVEINKMKIEVLGTGCPKCKKLEANAKKAVEETKSTAKIVKVSDISKIVEYGIMSTPAIVIDGEIKCYGRIADVKEIKKWL